MFQAKTGADAILHSLKTNGIDYLFANAGSDFAPIIESYSRPNTADFFPKPLIIPHESVAVGMAHGFYLATGRPQAVMVHVHVGLANATMGVINAQADNIPLVLLSGRTPLTEHDRLGSRATPVQYAQEVFDQTGIVRDLTKFNYELRYAEQANSLVNRACAIAQTEPAGPVYLSLPREPLAETLAEPQARPNPIKQPPPPAAPNPAALAQAAQLLAQAKSPLIIVQRGDTAGQVGRFVSRIAGRHAIKIVESGGVRNVVPSQHPMRIPGPVHAHVPTADVILVVDASVPWIEKRGRPDKNATVIHIGPDPLFQTQPMRSYQTDLCVAGNTAAILDQLSQALDQLEPETEDRYQRIEAEHNQAMAAMHAKAQAGSGAPMGAGWVGHCVSQALPENGLVFQERGPKSAQMIVPHINQLFGNTYAGGLGWGLPAAMGAQLADRDRLVVSIVGDGSYMFANPVACHQVMEAYQLPVLTIVMNNRRWNAVYHAAKEIYPDGHALNSDVMPLTDLSVSPDYVKIAQASRAYAEYVEDGGDLPAALDRAIHVIKNEKRPVLLEINNDTVMT